MKVVRLAVLPLLFLGFMILTGCGQNDKLEFKTPYSVVFLDNNNAYIGKVQQIGKDYFQLTNIFYIQTQMNPETKQVSNTLTKRGQELHKPNFMYINKQHIILIEPVTADSQVAKLIAQSEAQK
jgi:hypothetical protein